MAFAGAHSACGSSLRSRESRPWPGLLIGLFGAGLLSASDSPEENKLNHPIPLVLTIAIAAPILAEAPIGVRVSIVLSADLGASFGVASAATFRSFYRRAIAQPDAFTPVGPTRFDAAARKLG